MWQLVGQYYSANYTVFWLAEFFHSWPHISYNGLKKQDSTFDPSNEGYVQSLIFWAAVPILWLLVTLLASLLFSCCLCCRRRRAVDPSLPRPSVKCPQRFLVIAAFICLGLLGVGYYGNEAAAVGIHHFVNSADGINTTVSSVDSKIDEIENDLNSTIPSELTQLEAELRQVVTNQTALDIMLQTTAALKGASTSAAGNLSEVADELSHGGLDTSSLITDITFYDYFRWLGILLLLTFEVVTCLFVLLAASRASRYLLVFSSILCIMCILIIWCMVGAELFVEVGLGDLCVDPGRYLITQAQSHSEISEEILRYYIECTDSTTNPFSTAISQANNELAAAQKSVASLETMVQQEAPSAQEYVTLIKGTLQDVTLHTQQVTALVDCTGIHKNYISAVHGICYDTIAGIGFLLASGIVLGLLLTLVLCMSSTLASRIARRKIDYEVDQEDPFLPPQPSTATLERFRRRVPDSSDSAVRATPPPLAPISPTRPHSQHGFGPFDMLNTRPTGRTSYVSHQRDSFLEDPASPRGTYDSPPPSYTMAMRRDGTRGGTPHSRSSRAEPEEQPPSNERNRNRLSGGSASLV